MVSTLVFVTKDGKYLLVSIKMPKFAASMKIMEYEA